jgi:hypothetical protein
VVFHERYWSSVSEDAKDLLTQMLNVDPDARPQVRRGGLESITSEHLSEARLKS